MSWGQLCCLLKLWWWSDEDPCFDLPPPTTSHSPAFRTCTSFVHSYCTTPMCVCLSIMSWRVGAVVKTFVLRALICLSVRAFVCQCSFGHVHETACDVHSACTRMYDWPQHRRQLFLVTAAPSASEFQPTSSSLVWSRGYGWVWDMCLPTVNNGLKPTLLPGTDCVKALLHLHK